MVHTLLRHGADHLAHRHFQRDDRWCRSSILMSEGDVAAVLAASGLLPGPEGYEMAEILAKVEEHGWACWVEPLGSGGDERDRWRAVVFEPGKEGVAGPTRGYRGRGPTETAALASALARMLTRRGAQNSQAQHGNHSAT